MRKLFDKGVFLETLKQLIYLAILILFGGMIILFANTNAIKIDLYGYSYQSLVYSITDVTLIIIMLSGSTFLSILAVRFTCNRRRTDFEYSIPVTKGKLYASKVLAVISMQVGLLLVITTAGILLSIESLGQLSYVSDILIRFINAAIGSLIIIGIVFFTATITGQQLSFAILSLGIFILPLFVPISRYYTFVDRVTATGNEVYLFKPSLSIMVNMFFSTSMIDFSRYIPAMIVSLILALLYLFAGYFLYKKRSGELTGEHTKNKLVHYIVMSIVPFAIIYTAVNKSREYGLFVGDADSGDIISLITLLVAGLVLVFSYDIFVHKRIRRNNRCIWVFLALVILAGGANLAVQEYLLNEKEDKIISEQVESINVITNGEVVSIFNKDDEISYGEYIASNYEIKDKEIINELVNNYNISIGDYEIGENCSGKYYSLTIKFNFKSGKSMYKIVPVYAEYDVENQVLLRNIELQIKSLSGYADKYYEYVPIEYVTCISYSHAMLSKDIENKLREVYMIFSEEYSALSLKEKDIIKNINKTFAIPSIWLGEKEEIRQRGKLYVKGRVGSFDTMDIYYITDKYTPKAAKAFEELIKSSRIG